MPVPCLPGKRDKERKQRQKGPQKGEIAQTAEISCPSPQPYMRLTPLELEGSSAHCDQPGVLTMGTLLVARCREREKAK